MIPVVPTSYFGSIAYFREIAKHDHVLIEAKEHFPKQTYRNRCDIVGGDGIMSLSIPTKRSNGSKTSTDDVVLSDEENWRVRHWRSITSAYQSAVYFDYYSIEVEELLFAKESSLLEFNTAFAKRVIEWLDLGTTIDYTNEFTPIIENDFRINLIGKDNFQDIHKAPYIQVFPGDENFKESLSILDAVFCEGPMARNLLIPKG
ncbi:MAG: WbqC family protein [Crocinitomicaceae bacterium]